MKESFKISAEGSPKNMLLQLEGHCTDYFKFVAVCNMLIDLIEKENKNDAWKVKNGFWLAVMDAVNDSLKEASEVK